MDIRAYLDKKPKGGQKQFALRCGISPAYLSQIASGVRPCPEKVAIAFERESAGEVPCETSRPDVDWAYLRGSSSTEPVAADGDTQKAEAA